MGPGQRERNFERVEEGYTAHIKFSLFPERKWSLEAYLKKPDEGKETVTTRLFLHYFNHTQLGPGYAIEDTKHCFQHLEDGRVLRIRSDFDRSLAILYLLMHMLTKESYEEIRKEYGEANPDIVMPSPIVPGTIV